MAASRAGIASVLTMLNTRFCWGTRRATTLAEAMEQKGIDCGVSHNILHQALRLTKPVQAGTTCVARVQIVKTNSHQEAAVELNSYLLELPGRVAPGDMAGRLAYLSAWTRPNAVYHQTVGIVNMPDFGAASPMPQLRIWDYGGWYTPPKSWDADDAVVAIRLVLDDTEASRQWTEVEWCGMVLPVSSVKSVGGAEEGNARWITLMPPQVAHDRAVKAALDEAASKTAATGHLAGVLPANVRPPQESLGGYAGQLRLVHEALRYAFALVWEREGGRVGRGGEKKTERETEEKMGGERAKRRNPSRERRTERERDREMGG